MCYAQGCECGDTDCKFYGYTCGWCRRWAPLKFDRDGNVISPQGLVERLNRGEGFCQANDIGRR